MAHWVFDYDNTLYHPNCGVLDKIDVLIEEYIMDALDVTKEEAHYIREKYYRTYGTTVQGLIENHSINPHEYFDYIMNEDTVPLFDANTKRILEALPGEKTIFSNGTKTHIMRGLTILGITDFFTKIYDIHDINYISKPDVKPYRMVEQGIDDDIIFIDDSLPNIITAHSIGWKSILINRYDDIVPEGIVSIDSLDELLTMELV